MKSLSKYEGLIKYKGFVKIWRVCHNMKGNPSSPLISLRFSATNVLLMWRNLQIIF